MKLGAALIYSGLGKHWLAMSIGTVWIAGVTWLSANRTEPDPADFLPQEARNYEGIRPSYTPAEMVWILPMIKQQACFRAAMAVRYHLRPALVSGPLCGTEDKTEIDDELIVATVSGISTVGNVKHPFTVTLEHYPTSLKPDGFIIQSINVGQTDPDVLRQSDAR